MESRNQIPFLPHGSSHWLALLMELFSCPHWSAKPPLLYLKGQHMHHVFSRILISCTAQNAYLCTTCNLYILFGKSSQPLHIWKCSAILRFFLIHINLKSACPFWQNLCWNFCGERHWIYRSTWGDLVPLQPFIFLFINKDSSSFVHTLLLHLYPSSPKSGLNPSTTFPNFSTTTTKEGQYIFYVQIF